MSDKNKKIAIEKMSIWYFRNLSLVIKNSENWYFYYVYKGTKWRLEKEQLKAIIDTEKKDRCVLKVFQNVLKCSEIQL